MSGGWSSGFGSLVALRANDNETIMTSHPRTELYAHCDAMAYQAIHSRGDMKNRIS